MDVFEINIRTFAKRWYLRKANRPSFKNMFEVYNKCKKHTYSPKSLSLFSASQRMESLNATWIIFEFQSSLHNLIHPTTIYKFHCRKSISFFKNTIFYIYIYKILLIIILGLVNRPTLKPDFFVFIVIFTFPEICPDSILASVSMNEWDELDLANHIKWKLFHCWHKDFKTITYHKMGGYN